MRSAVQWHPRLHLHPSQNVPPSSAFWRGWSPCWKGTLPPCQPTRVYLRACARPWPLTLPPLLCPTARPCKGPFSAGVHLFLTPWWCWLFFLDPFWSPVRARLSCLLWGGQSLVALRDAAVDRLCLSDAAAKAALLTELAGFAALEVQHAGHAASRDLHPVLWWRLWGASLQVLQPLAVRLLSTPPSAAGGERMLKTLKGVLSTQRNRLAPQRADTQTRLAFNARQMGRACLIAGYRRSEAEIQLLAMLNGEVGAGAPVAGPMAPVADDGGAASEGDESSGEFEEGTSTARLTEDATVER